MFGASSWPNMRTSFPFCSQLAAGWDKPWILFAAALYHDIAKGRGGEPLAAWTR
jgi:[protein-PII] uridylyltransferase